MPHQGKLTFIATGLALLLALAHSGRGQEAAGAIRGVVYDADFDGPVPEAIVRLLELDRQTKSGDDGHFLFEAIPAGSYTLVVLKSGYERHVESSVVVVPGSLADITVRLKGEFTEMEEFVVRELEIGDTATDIGLLSLRSSSLTFQDSIGGDLMSKAGASDAAGALKLVVGASVVDGKFATVRGLSDRYVGAAVNSLRVPSSDPKKRAVHMDIFPAGTIESISVSKTFTPDLPGDYTGGGVNIRTVAIPDKPFAKISISRGFNREDTGKPGFVTYLGGGVNRWGRHGGARGMPEGLDSMEEDGFTSPALSSSHDDIADEEHPHSAEYRGYDRLVRSLAPAMGTMRRKLPGDHGYTLSAGGRRELGGGWDLGGTAAFTYSHKYNLREESYISHKVPPVTDPVIDDQSYFRDIGSDEVKWSMMGAVGIERGEEHSFTLTGIRNRSAEDSASFQTDQDPDFVNGFWQRQGIHYVERAVDIVQMRAQHRWDALFTERLGLELDFFAARNAAEQEEPDVRFFQNVKILDTNGMFRFRLRPQGLAGADSDSSTRAWRNTREDNSLYGFNITFPFRLDVPNLHDSFLGLGATEDAWEEREGAFKIGLVSDWTRREYRQNSFYYTFASQGLPTDTGPQLFEYPTYEEWLIARDAWEETPEGEAYLDAKDDADADGELRFYSTDDPNELWTDVFTDPGRLGLGDYQDSMRWYLVPRFYDTDYSGYQNFHSSYWMVQLPVTRQLTFNLGARLEVTDIRIDPSSDREAVNPDEAFQIVVANPITNQAGEVITRYFLDTVGADEARAEIQDADWLRSAGFVYELQPGMNLRFTWSRTIARPTFLELAPVISFDYIEDETFVGNNNLRISRIENVDLRWEWFRAPGEVYAISWFGKQIEDPIERLSFGYLVRDYFLAVNFPEGTVTGMELELRKPLDFLPGLLRHFSLGANYTLIDATVKVPRDLYDSLTFFGLEQKERDMEGQPEFLANVNLTYDDEQFGTSAGLFYNVQGDILKSGAAVGDGAATPNIYALEYPTLDLSLSQRVARHWKVSFRARNLLDPYIEEVYRQPDGTEVLRRRYRKGVSYSFGLGASW